MVRKIVILLYFSLFLALQGCNYNITAGTDDTVIGDNNLDGLEKLNSVSGISLVTPSSSPDISTTPTIRISGLKSQDTVYIYSDSSCSSLLATGASTGSSVDITLPALPEGTNTIYAKRRWPSANIESDCSTLFLSYEVIDTTPPLAPSVTSSLALTAVKRPTWTWSSGGGGIGTYRYKLDDSDLSTGATEATATSFTPTSDLSVGTHTLNVQEKDDAGNWSDSGNYSLQVASNAYFIKAIGGTNADYFQSVIELSTGGLVAVGYTNGPSGGVDYDAYIVKFDENGSKVWAKTIGSNGDDYFTSVVEFSDGGLVAVGYTDSSGAGYDDGFLVKFDGVGDKVWAKTIGGAENDGFDSVIETSDGGIVAAGYTTSYGIAVKYGLLVKFDASGVVQWDKTTGGTLDENFASVIELSTGGFVAVGRTKSDGAGNNDAYIVKFDEDGDEDWEKTIGASNQEAFYSVTELSDGNLVAAGFNRSYVNNIKYGYIVQINAANGAVIWDKAIGGNTNGELHSVTESSDGSIVAAGFNRSIDNGVSKYGIILKVNPTDGAVVWNKSIGKTNFDDQFYSIIQLSGGGLVAAGFSGNDGGAGLDDGFLVSLENDGGLGNGSSDWHADAVNASTEGTPGYSSQDFVSTDPGGVPNWTTQNADAIFSAFDADNADTETEIFKDIVP